MAHDTPTLPFPHYFSSATWDAGDKFPTSDVGPIPEAERVWVGGALNIPFAPPIPFGQAADFIADRNPSSGAYTGELRAGIPETCWTQTDYPDIDPRNPFSIGSCCLKLAYLKIIEHAYFHRFEHIQDFITAWLGPGPQVFFFEQADVTPAMFIVRSPAFVLVFCTGTDNTEQWVIQLLDGGLPPQPAWGVNTLPIWAITADTLMTRMREVGVGATEPVLLAGHSYGGAVCCVTAARMRLANPEREMTLITWGCPKPGDAAMQDIIRTMPHEHVANLGDIVHTVPWNLVDTEALAGWVLRSWLLGWNDWQAHAFYTHVNIDGTEEFGPVQSVPFDALLPIVLLLLAGQPFQIGFQHTIAEYVRRARLHCEGPCWPIPPDAWEILFPADRDGAEAGVAIPQLHALACAGFEIPHLSAVGLAGYLVDDGPAQVLAGMEASELQAVGEAGMESSELQAVGEAGMEASELQAVGEAGMESSELQAVGEAGMESPELQAVGEAGFEV